MKVKTTLLYGSTKLLLVSMLMLGTLALFVQAVAAQANIYSGYDSVNNSSGEIRHKSNYTKYESTGVAHAIGVWHGLGEVPILGDTVFTPLDLDFADYSYCGGATYGVWSHSANGTDYIQFNTCNIDNQPGIFAEYVIATHEVGHALGLADLYQSQFSSYLMYYALLPNAPTEPTPTEEGWYYSLWGN